MSSPALARERLGGLSRRTAGVALAFGAALVSGVSVYANGYAVKHFSDETVYTTAKNTVAGVLLVAMLLAYRARRGAVASPVRPTARQWLALFAVGVVGGSVPFVLFFEGLARAQATQAAFIQKTLVVWVALLAVPILRERFGLPHLLAVAALVAGQAWLVGHAGRIAWGSGETMILAATLLWAVEVVFVKHLMATLAPSTLAAGRMGIGAVILLSWVWLSGRGAKLDALDALQWRWVLLTGLLLTVYVASWYAALARAQAVDVTAVLVFGALVTAVLSGAFNGAPISVVGSVLVAAGTGTIALLALRGRAPQAGTP